MTEQQTPYYAAPKQPRLIWNNHDKRRAAEPLPTQTVEIIRPFYSESKKASSSYYPDFLVRLTDGSLYIVESKSSIRERDRAKQSRAERYADILRESTGKDWRCIFLVNDSSIGRQDMAWWRQQGRTMFRDLVKYTQNAATGVGMC